jgi:hypothetical protein
MYLESAELDTVSYVRSWLSLQNSSENCCTWPGVFRNHVTDIIVCFVSENKTIKFQWLQYIQKEPETGPADIAPNDESCNSRR